MIFIFDVLNMTDDIIKFQNLHFIEIKHTHRTDYYADYKISSIKELDKYEVINDIIMNNLDKYKYIDTPDSKESLYPHWTSYDFLFIFDSNFKINDIEFFSYPCCGVGYGLRPFGRKYRFDYSIIDFGKKYNIIKLLDEYYEYIDKCRLELVLSKEKFEHDKLEFEEYKKIELEKLKKLKKQKETYLRDMKKLINRHEMLVEDMKAIGSVLYPGSCK